MKLLSKSDAGNKIRKDNDELIGQNIRLRQMERQIVDRLNNAKDDYEPDKLAKLRVFERFVKDINIKEEKLLRELAEIQKIINDKRELYYGLIERQDKLEEKIYLMREQEKKLDLREAFVVDLEKKWKEKQ